MKTHDITISIGTPTQLDLNVEPTNNFSFNVNNEMSSIANYDTLLNKPQIENVTLKGNKDFEDLGLIPMDIDDLLDVLI